MNRNTLCTIALVILLVVMGACDDNAWESTPDPIQNFISEYFPFGEVSSCTKAANGDYTVEIKNGATLSFGSNYKWIDVNGNGVVLPDNFLYDEMPEDVYNFLLETSQTASVYRTVRNSVDYTIYLPDTYITYNIASKKITYPSASED